MDRNDVICAISTAPGVGAIAVLRLSGAGAIALTDRVFVSPSGKNLRMWPGIRCISDGLWTERSRWMRCW